MEIEWSQSDLSGADGALDADTQRHCAARRAGARTPRDNSAFAAFRRLTVLAFVFLCASAAANPASAVPTSPCPSIDYTDEEVSIIFMRHLYAAERFGELDDVLGCLLRDERAFSSGKPSGAIAYEMFRRAMPGSGVTQADLERVGRWAQHRQGQPSMFVEFAALRLRYAFAWNLRGSGYAKDVTEAQWRAFHEALAQTEEALYRATPALRETTLGHQLLLALTGDTPTLRANMASVFDAAVKRWPTNYDLHGVVLTRLVPRWGGSWEHVDAFIREYADKRKGREADALYARLYGTLLLAMDDDPRETRMDWLRMKRGLESLVALYPDPRHANMAASFACLYGEAPYFKTSLGRIPKHHLRATGWLPGADLKSCLVGGPR